MIVVPAHCFDRLWNAACAGLLSGVTLSLSNIPDARNGTRVLAAAFWGRKPIT
jgi:hypothetical protein